MPVGAPGPDAHHQPCSHLKEEARQLSQGEAGGRCTVDYTLNIPQHKKPLGWIQNVLVTDVGPNERCTTAPLQERPSQFDAGSQNVPKGSKMPEDSESRVVASQKMMDVFMLL